MRRGAFLSKFFVPADSLRALMARTLRRLLLVLFLAALAAVGLVLWNSGDPSYTAQEWLAAGRYARYDAFIGDVARKHGLDPLLVKAVVWRESAFQPAMVGTSGERGLMQVSEAAAQDWATAEKMENFAPTDLFDPKTNLEAGSWYLRQALERWREKAEPLPFALAEYNAGGTRVERWIEESGRGEAATARDLLLAIDFPTTHRYIKTITARHRFYQERARRR